MKWIRPLHDEQTTETDSELITPISQIVNTHGFHPFYRSLVEENITRLKGVGRVVERCLLNQPSHIMLYLCAF